MNDWWKEKQTVVITPLEVWSRLNMAASALPEDIKDHWSKLGPVQKDEFLSRMAAAMFLEKPA